MISPDAPNEKERSAFSRDFPLWPAHKFDLAFENSPWPLAMHSIAPRELKRRVASALSSYFLRLKSIDYTLKRYSHAFDYDDGDPGRLDLKISAHGDTTMRLVSQSILKISEVEPKSLGETIGEWTIFRAPFGMEILLSCANRGALFESLTITRMLLEQLAWSFAAISEQDEDRVARIGTQSSMRFLKTIIPASGRFYGWLSDHAHWNYEAHVKGITVKEGRLGHLFASADFKAVALCAALVLTSIYLRSIDELMRSNAGSTLAGHPLRQDLADSERQNCLLLSQVLSLDPNNRDIVALTKILS